jgi:2-dehydro-3-deoxyphosphooctonate aldolase (KDO 8-P synthase)
MTVRIQDIEIGGANPIVLIAGPCQLETLDHARMMAEGILNACAPTGTKVIFKASFDKANRTSIHGQRGPGIDEGLAILACVRDEFDVPVLTDVHLPDQCAQVAEVCDVLQIPAFLSRQTDLLVAAGQTGKAVNIKKGQFLASQDMAYVAEKVSNTGNNRILLTERGTSFGYNTLINDFRALPQMANTGYPVIFDATHSVQEPGGKGSKSGGNRDFVAPLARAACAVGVAGIFLETHQDPDTAPSDGPNMVPLSELGTLVAQLRAIDSLTKSF